VKLYPHSAWEPWERRYYHGRMAGACLTIGCVVLLLAKFFWLPLIIIALPFLPMLSWHLGWALTAHTHLINPPPAPLDATRPEA
jgi:hypothetical protein